MAQQLQHPATELYYVIVLLLLSYVMSSAPKYVRDWRENQDKTAPIPLRHPSSWKKVLAAYTIQPYTNAWKKLQQQPVNVKSPSYLAAQ